MPQCCDDRPRRHVHVLVRFREVAARPGTLKLALRTRTHARPLIWVRKLKSGPTQYVDALRAGRFPVGARDTLRTIPMQQFGSPHRSMHILFVTNKPRSQIPSTSKWPLTTTYYWLFHRPGENFSPPIVFAIWHHISRFFRMHRRRCSARSRNSLGAWSDRWIGLAGRRGHTSSSSSIADP